MSIEQAVLIADLADIVAQLPREANIFAGKMIKAFDYFGKLSAAQEAVVREILARHPAESLG